MDPLDRLTQVTHPIGSTVFSYQDSSNQVTTTKSMEGSTSIVSKSQLDGLGRLSETVQIDSYQGSTSQDVVDRTYDPLGRVKSVSNPYRTTATDWTTTTYDALDRPLSITFPDNSQTTISYTDNATLTKDPANKWKTTIADALGRVTQVVEDPVVAGQNPSGAGWTTIYTYDSLGNLKTSNQGGQARGFTYDGLSRLKTATSPETGLAVTEGDGQDQNGTLRTTTILLGT